jgi:hypothetical protein
MDDDNNITNSNISVCDNNSSNDINKDGNSSVNQTVDINCILHSSTSDKDQDILQALDNIIQTCQMQIETLQSLTYISSVDTSEIDMCKRKIFQCLSDKRKLFEKKIHELSSP